MTSYVIAFHSSRDTQPEQGNCHEQVTIYLRTDTHIEPSHVYAYPKKQEAPRGVSPRGFVVSGGARDPLAPGLAPLALFLEIRPE